MRMGFLAAVNMVWGLSPEVTEHMLCTFGGAAEQRKLACAGVSFDAVSVARRLFPDQFVHGKAACAWRECRANRTACWRKALVKGAYDEAWWALWAHLDSRSCYDERCLEVLNFLHVIRNYPIHAMVKYGRFVTWEDQQLCTACVQNLLDRMHSDMPGTASLSRELRYKRFGAAVGLSN